MAKQRGTHQISGTINNLVYYQQKYVKGGLIRRQNEAMSNRLKEDPIFSNTRDANALFGGCMMMASALLSISSRRLSVMTKPSRNANLTASFLRMYQSVSGTSKEDSILMEDLPTYALLESTDRLMKTPISKFFTSINRFFYDLSMDSEVDIDFRGSELESYARSCEVDRIQIEFYGPMFIGSCNKDSTSRKYLAPDVFGRRIVDTYTWNLGDGDLPVTLSAVSSNLPRGFVFCTILPVISGVGMTARFKIENAIGFYIVLDYA